MFEAIGVIGIICAVIVFLLAFYFILSIGYIVWIIYAIIVICLIAWNIYLFCIDDEEKIITAIGSVFGIVILTFIAKFIESIFNWWF